MLREPTTDISNIAFEPDPISEAILLRIQPDRARNLAQYHPTLFDSTPAFNFRTHLHLAIEAKQCFSELLMGLLSAATEENLAASATLASLLVYQDVQSGSLAEVLVTSCDTLCPWTRRAKDRRQPCWAASMLKTWFALHGSIHHSSLYIYDDQCNSYLDLYTAELARRRQTLKHLAARHLTPLQVKHFELDLTPPLDRHANSVVKALREIKIDIPSYLITVDSDSDLSAFWPNLSRLDTGHIIWARSLYSAGFRDISMSLVDSCTALRALIYDGPAQVNALKLFNLIDWVVEHSPTGSMVLCEAWGATRTVHSADRSLNCVVYRHENAVTHGTIAHFLGGSIGYRLYLKSWCAFDREKTPVHLGHHPLLAKILPLTIVDHTSCVCSPLGRTPFAYMLMDFLISDLCLDTAQHFADALDNLANAFGDLWEPWHFKAAVRLITFEWLAMEHTCDFYQQDIDHDNQGTAFDSMLEELLEEITNEFDDLIDKRFTTSKPFPTAECRSQGSETGTAADEPVVMSTREQRDQNCRAAAAMCEPWLERWVERMDMVLEQLYPRDAAIKHCDATEELGILWCEPLPPPTTEAGVKKTREDWIRELQNT